MCSRLDGSMTRAFAKRARNGLEVAASTSSGRDVLRHGVTTQPARSSQQNPVLYTLRTKLDHAHHGIMLAVKKGLISSVVLGAVYGTTVPDVCAFEAQMEALEQARFYARLAIHRFL